jgi:hypothetical protein
VRQFYLGAPYFPADLPGKPIGTEIVPQVLAATADGQFVWMKPQ